jgi:exonuclease III
VWGVVILCMREKYLNGFQFFNHELQIPDGDQGRRRLIVFNLYSPFVNRCDPQNDVEQTAAYKILFHWLVTKRAEALVKEGCFVLIIGDLNSVYKAIDQSDATEEVS